MNGDSYHVDTSKLNLFQLRRRGYQVYFHKKMKECDFVCLQHNKIISVIQVCEFLTPENYTRETEGLLEATKFQM